jgi:hypothetical protein
MGEIKLNAFVCDTQVILNRDLTEVCLFFKIADPGTRLRTEREHRLGMSAQEAMRLLGLLLQVQKKIGLPLDPREPYTIVVPPAKDQN